MRTIDFDHTSYAMMQLPNDLSVHFRYSSPYVLIEERFVTREPNSIKSLYQHFNVFQLPVWIAIICTLASLAVSFKFIHFIYLNKINPALAGSVTHPMDFIILSTASITEPDPLPWFPKFSAGKLLVLVWDIFCLNINFFYYCNLRTQLMMVEYENPIDSNQAVIESGRPFYMETNTYYTLVMITLVHTLLMLSQQAEDF